MWTAVKYCRMILKSTLLKAWLTLLGKVLTAPTKYASSISYTATHIERKSLFSETMFSYREAEAVEHGGARVSMQCLVATISINF